MALLVAPMIVRHMKHAASFAVRRDTNRLPFPWDETDERVVGWYDNPPPWSHVRVVFTERAMYTADDSGISRIALRDIIDYEVPNPKEAATGVRVVTQDGIAFVRLAGRSGARAEYIDAFALVGFLHAYLGATLGHGR